MITLEEPPEFDAELSAAAASAVGDSVGVFVCPDDIGVEVLGEKVGECVCPNEVGDLELGEKVGEYVCPFAVGAVVK